MAFHLDVGAGSALAAAPRISAPPSMPSRPSVSAPPRMPASTGTPAPTRPPASPAVAATSPAVPPVAPPDAGGRGWGVREQRPALYPTWVPISETSGSAGGPSAGGPSAGGAYAGVGLYPGYGHPTRPASSAPRVGRSRAAFRTLALLVFVALVGAGAFLYLSSESSRGLGSGTHTVSVPATLGGLSQVTSSSTTALGSEIKSEMDGTSGVTGSAYAMYGSATFAGPAYELAMGSLDHPVAASRLTQSATNLNAGAVSFDFATATVSTANGVDFHCGPLTAYSVVMGTICLWVDGNVTGLVLGSSEAGGAATLAAAEEARNTAEH